MVLEFYFTETEEFIKVLGILVLKKVQAQKLGLMTLSMKVNILKVSFMGTGSTHTPMVVNTAVNG